MEFKTLSLILLLSWGYTTNAAILGVNGNPGIHAEDFGPQIKDAIDGILQGLPDPIVLLKTDPTNPLRFNLTEITYNKTIEIGGEIDIYAVSVNGLHGVEVIRSSAILDGILKPFPFNLALSGSSIQLAVQYSMDATIENFIPVRGAGLITVSLEGLEVGIAGNITNLITKLKLGDFDFVLELDNLRVVIDGLLDDPTFSEAVGELLTVLLTTEIVNPIKDALSERHQVLVSLAKDIFNGFELTLADLLELLNPKPELNLKAMFPLQIAL